MSTRPLTNQRCISSTTSAGGIIASIAVAITVPHSVCASPPEIMRLMPITTDESMAPVVLGIKKMISGGDAATEWNAVMATAILAMIPPALVVMLMQKWFVKGLVDTEK